MHTSIRGPRAVLAVMGSALRWTAIATQIGRHGTVGVALPSDAIAGFRYL